MHTLTSDYITNIQKFSIHDGPGIRTNVFFKGCCLKCKWCANPEGIRPTPELLYTRRKCVSCGTCVHTCPNHALTLGENGITVNRDLCRHCGACTKTCPGSALKISGKVMTPDEVFHIVNQDKVFYETSGGGVTFSGGEPFLHPKFIKEVAEKCKAEGYSVCAETCGFFSLEDVLPVIPLFDLLLYDIKIVNNEKHKIYCGESNERIHKNFAALVDQIPIIPRIPIIPGVNDTPEDIKDFQNFFRPFKEYLTEVDILAYHTLGLSKYEMLGRPYELSELSTPSDEHMQWIKTELEKVVPKVVIGG